PVLRESLAAVAGTIRAGTTDDSLAADQRLLPLRRTRRFGRCQAESDRAAGPEASRVGPSVGLLQRQLDLVDHIAIARTRRKFDPERWREIHEPALALAGSK